MSPVERNGFIPRPENLVAPLSAYAACYEQWLVRQISQKTLMANVPVPDAQRKALLADWLRELVASGQLKSRDRLPMYAALGATFALSDDQVASVVRQLRREKVLARRRPRQDAGKPQWQRRDNYCLGWIGEQRAIRYDQLQRLLVRESDGQPADSQQLSMTRTTQIIGRWQRAHLVEYRKIYVRQPGWIWLTRKGLAFVDQEYRPGVPAESLLNHLYYINEVRLALEDEYPWERLDWTSERELQHWREEMRERGSKLSHTPDAIAEVDGQEIDIEVELTRKPQYEIERVLCGKWVYASSTNALRYYVSRQARTTVKAAWKEVQRAYVARGLRPWVEIVELDDLFRRPEQRRGG
jgi:hypothetical protein